MDDPTISYRAPDTKQLRAVDRDTRTIDVIASTGSIDSHGTRIDQKGWILTQFKKNPVITWAHDDRGFTASAGLPIARAKNIKVKDDQLVMKIEFPEEGKSRFSDNVFELMADGFLNAVSVGFEAIESEVIEEKGNDVRIFTKSKLLEVAVVTIPSNDEALVVRAKELGQDLDEIVRRTVTLEAIIEKEKSVHGDDEDRAEHGVVPTNVSTSLAPEEEEWSKPTLSDFTDKPFGDLTDAEKRKIAGHFAWCLTVPPNSFGECKLPHHRASDGKVVFRGLVAATGRLNQTDVGDDLPAVKRHLRAHYRAFEKDIPEVLRSYEPQDKLEEYYDTKQPSNRAATKVLKSFYNKIDRDIPEDIVEAWEEFNELISAFDAVGKTIKMPSTQSPAEAPQEQAVKPTVYRVSSSELVAAREDIMQKCTDAALAASRKGMPAKDIEAMVKGLSESLIESFISSFSKT